MFDKGTRAHGVYTLIESLILFVAGILLLVFRENRDAYSVALIAVGIMVILSSALNLIFDFLMTIQNPVVGAATAKRGTLTTFSLELALGIALIIGGVSFNQAGNGGDILRVFNFGALFVGLTLIVLGALFVLYGIIWAVRAPKGTKLSCVGTFILAALIITFGVLVLVFIWNSGDDALMRFIFIFGGIFLLLLGFFGAATGLIEIIRKPAENDRDVIDNDNTEE